MIYAFVLHGGEGRINTHLINNQHIAQNGASTHISSTEINVNFSEIFFGF